MSCVQVSLVHGRRSLVSCLQAEEASGTSQGNSDPDYVSVPSVVTVDNEDAACAACPTADRPNELLLRDNCNGAGAQHISCLEPSLLGVIEGFALSLPTVLRLLLVSSC